jgi:CHAT domain
VYHRRGRYEEAGPLYKRAPEGIEPGLVLTPPQAANEEDDGYLNASKIVALKLDADWVVSLQHGGGRALSGLAQAFFNAQARAVLVSHWEVNSDATTSLIAGAMKRLGADRTLGRTEAMHQSMVALIDSGKLYQAHPAFWAPFVIVGEGSAAR